jgi:hypothetical protein
MEKMVDQGITSDPRYMHQNGKPVLLIWGFFPSRPASQPDYMNPVLDFLLAPGKYQATMVGGVDNTWRAKGTSEFQAMLMRMQGLQPWSVGRRTKDPVTGYSVQNTSEWVGDMAKCKANNVMFMPVFNSGTHVAGPPPTPPAAPVVPRRTGNYLWEQFIAASKTGTINSVFVAMFDEINEGTQIMKIENHPPTQAPFLTYDGATSDYYLRLVGAGAKLLKAHAAITPVIPISPFDAAKSYRIKSRTTGAVLNEVAKTIDAANAKTNADWQFAYDGAGYFTIKNKLSGKVLNNGLQGTVTFTNDNNTDNAKWHLEWDGTGYCRIINKATSKAIIAANINLVVNQTTDAAKDELRWQIIPE